MSFYENGILHHYLWEKNERPLKIYTIGSIVFLRISGFKIYPKKFCKKFCKKKQSRESNPGPWRPKSGTLPSMLDSHSDQVLESANCKSSFFQDLKTYTLQVLFLFSSPLPRPLHRSRFRFSFSFSF